MSTRYDLSDPESREAGLAAAVGRRTPRPAGRAPDRHRLRHRRGRLRRRRGPAAPRREGTRAGHAAAGPGLGHDHVGRTRHRPPRMGRGADRALLARARSRSCAASSRRCGGTWGRRKGTVAVRMPDDQAALDLLGRTGPLAVSSANVTGQPAATDADAAERMLGESVEVVLDDGPSPGTTASTIVDCTGKRPRILRAGALTAEELAPVLEDLGAELEHRAGARGPSFAGGRPGPCVSTCSSSSWPVSSATCCASSPASWRSGPVPWPGCATATCTRPRSPTSVAWPCSVGSGRGCWSLATCRSSAPRSPPSSTTPGSC